MGFWYSISLIEKLNWKRQASTAKSYSTTNTSLPRFVQWNQRSLTLKNVSTIWFQNDGDKLLHCVFFINSRKWSNSISPMAGWSKREDWSLLLLFVFCYHGFCNKGKTLKNVAFAFNKDILGKIIEQGGVCSITVAFDFEKRKQTKKKRQT